MRNDIIKFLLPLATTKTSNHQKTTIENSTHHQNQKTPTFANKPTYSAIAAQNPTHATIIINKPDDNDTSTTSTSTIINKISQHITEKKIPATIQRTATSKNNIIIKFNRTDNVKAVAGELQTELGLQARARSPYLPKLTMSHIPAHINLEDNLKEKIIEQNPDLQAALKTGTLDILFTYKPKDFGSAVLKVTPNVRQAILGNNNSTLVIGNRACPVRDRTQPMRCTKCCGFGHTRTHCRAITPICNFCADEHSTSTCTYKTIKEKHCCHNCLQHGKQSHNHTASDTNCPIAKAETIKLIKNTDYGTCPPQI